MNENPMYSEDVTVGRTQESYHDRYLRCVHPYVAGTGRVVADTAKVAADVGGVAIRAAGDVGYQLTTGIVAPGAAEVVKVGVGSTWRFLRNLLRRG